MRCALALVLLAACGGDAVQPDAAAPRTYALDPAFGDDGVVTLPFPPSTDVLPAAALATDGDLVILFGGYANMPGAVCRLNADGALEGGFGGVGCTALAGEGAAYGLAVTSDAITVSGSTPSAATQSIVVWRLDNAGAPIASFGGTGRIELDAPQAQVFGHSVVAEPEGTVVVAADSHDAVDHTLVLRRVDVAGAIVASEDQPLPVTSTAATRVGGGFVLSAVRGDEGALIRVDAALTLRSDFGLAGVAAVGVPLRGVVTSSTEQVIARSDRGIHAFTDAGDLDLEFSAGTAARDHAIADVAEAGGLLVGAAPSTGSAGSVWIGTAEGDPLDLDDGLVQVVVPGASVAAAHQVVVSAAGAVLVIGTAGDPANPNAGAFVARLVEQR